MADAALITVFHVAILILFFSGVKSNECNTPQETPGECVRLTSCEPLTVLIRKKPLTHQNRVFLRQSQCDFINGHPWVCCPKAKEAQFKVLRYSTLSSRNKIIDSSELLKAGESVCGKPFKSLEDRIYGGGETSLGEFPWMAALLYETTNRRSTFGCGGSLITNRHVLTAAHCVIAELIPSNWYLTRVRLGEWDRATNPDCQELEKVFLCASEHIDFNIARVFSHEFYQISDENKFNDIAILKLESTVVFTDFVRPICIDLDSSIDTFYGTATAIGFGATESYNTSQRMIKAEIDIVTHQDCQRKYRLQGRQVTDKQICATKNNVDTCKGDSGAGLMMQSDTSPSFWYLVGVTSFGPSRCGSSDYPGIYTKVEAFITWIQNKIKL